MPPVYDSDGYCVSLLDTFTRRTRPGTTQSPSSLGPRHHLFSYCRNVLTVHLGCDNRQLPSNSVGSNMGCSCTGVLLEGTGVAPNQFCRHHHLPCARLASSDSTDQKHAAHLLCLDATWRPVLYDRRAFLEEECPSKILARDLACDGHARIRLPLLCGAQAHAVKLIARCVAVTYSEADRSY